MAVQLREKLNKLAREKEITPKALRELRGILEITNDPWNAIRGILKGKKIDPVAAQRKLRREWDRLPG